MLKGHYFEHRYSLLRVLLVRLVLRVLLVRRVPTVLLERRVLRVLRVKPEWPELRA